MPDQDPAAAARAAFGLHPALPSVPEMPRRDACEGMLARLLAEVRVVRDPVRGRLAVLVGDPTLESTFDATPGLVPPRGRAAGLDAVLAWLGAPRGGHAPASARGAVLPELLKAAVVGPVALARALRDDRGRSAASHPPAADAVARFATRSGIRLAASLRGAGVLRPVIQLDEPGTTDDLTADETRRLADALRALRAAGAYAAIHDCGARRGEAALALDPDLLLVDATTARPPLLAVPEALRAYLSRGGSIAWGIVPTSPPFPDAVAAVRRLLADFASAGVPRDLLLSRSWLSPACGLGASSAPDAAAARAGLAAARLAWR